MKKNINNGFTLVELIVVITILAILGTIAYISLQGYTKYAKDTTNVSNIKNIEKVLTYFKLDKGFFPKPNNSISITYSGAKVWEQGVFGKGNFENISTLSTIPKDGNDNLYTYSLSSKGTEYQLASVVNSVIGKYNNNIISNSYASSLQKSIAYVSGTYNGKMAMVSSGSTIYLLSIPSIITNTSGSLDIVDIINNKKLIFNGYNNLPLNYKGGKYDINGGFNYITNNNIEIFSGTLDDLVNNVDKKLDIFKKLKKSYTGTIIADNYNDLFDVKINKIILPINLVTNILNNSFGIYSRLSINPVFEGFGIGFGGASAFPFKNTAGNSDVYIESADLILDKNIGNNLYYKTIDNFNSNNFTLLQTKLKDSKFVVYWVTPGWSESWFNLNNIQKLMDSGVIPVFSYWYFGDSLVNGTPTISDITSYNNDSIRFRNMLKKLNGYKLVLMEPEFNKDSIISSKIAQDNFIKIISDSIDIIKAGNKDTYFSLTMIDRGSRKVSESRINDITLCPNYDNCSFGDQKIWGEVEYIFNSLSDKLDFISFQEMVGQFSRDPIHQGLWSTPNPISYSIGDTGIENLEKRIENISYYLNNKYNKPVFLPYITIMTDTWGDNNLNSIIDLGEITSGGFENEANSFYYKFSKSYKILKEKGLFGYAVMELFDNPKKDAGGYKYFMDNECKQGIIHTNPGSCNGVSFPIGDIVFKGTGSIIDMIYSGLN